MLTLNKCTLPYKIFLSQHQYIIITQYSLPCVYCSPRRSGSAPACRHTRSLAGFQTPAVLNGPGLDSTCTALETASMLMHSDQNYIYFLNAFFLQMWRNGILWQLGDLFLCCQSQTVYPVLFSQYPITQFDKSLLAQLSIGAEN